MAEASDFGEPVALGAAAQAEPALAAAAAAGGRTPDRTPWWKDRHLRRWFLPRRLSSKPDRYR